MTIRQFWEKCKTNWPVKIICFVLAVFIYFFYKNTTLTSRSVIVPLGISSDGNMLPAGYHQPQVKVTLRGETEDISQIKDSDISASLNIDFYTQAGKYDIPVQVNLAPFVLELEPLEVNVSPAMVPLEVAPRAYAQVPVNVDVQGEPAKGYRVTDISVIPSTIGITGAAPQVESVDTMTTATVSLDGRTTSFSQDMIVRNANKLVSFTEGAFVSVSVGIEPVQIKRTFENQTVYLYGLNPSYVARFEPANVSFTLAGPQLKLEDYAPELYTIRVDCTMITEPGEYELPVSVTVPNGTTLVSQGAKSVKIFVTDVSVQSETEQDTGASSDDSIEESTEQ